MPADTDSLRNRARMAQEQHGLSNRQAADTMGVAYSTYSAWLNNSYAGNNTKIDDAVGKWLTSLEAQKKERDMTPTIPGFIMTATATRIFAMLDGAKFGPDMAMIAGDAGVGKTVALKAYQRRNNNAWMVTARPAMKSPTAILTRIAKELGVRERGSGLDEAIIERMADTGGLLIVDEAVKRHGKVTPSEGGQAAKNDPFLRNGFTMAFMLNGGPVWDACCGNN
ncbi:AAA family ATPase, partial [Komagataeibacter rhaeticus]|uniref:AAA family ATPase n=1 Tax=Komagataeibacter rhaeticus TaxID=215221 RepID=UPI001A4034D8